MSNRDEVILETDSVRVRILVLEAGQATAWHFHSEVTDRMLCLEGRVAVEYAPLQTPVELRPGDRCEVSVGEVHRVVNRAPETSKYLLVQGVGRYDFNVVPGTDQ